MKSLSKLGMLLAFTLLWQWVQPGVEFGIEHLTRHLEWVRLSVPVALFGAALHNYAHGCAHKLLHSAVHAVQHRKAAHHA